MKKDNIVQFVGFVTNLPFEEFVPRWENYSKRQLTSNSEPILHQKEPEAKNKFRYISQQGCPELEFHLINKNERRSDHFPDQNVRIIQIGGFVPLKQKRRSPEDESDIKLIAFISHDETELDFYGDLPFYHNLNIYQAYFESCLYGYVMEFFVSEKEADDLLRQLKQRQGIETGIYKECFVPHG